MCIAYKNAMRSRTSDIAAGVRRLRAEQFHTARNGKRRVCQASEADVDRRFHLSRASLWILPSAVFRRDPGNRAGDTSYPTQFPPLAMTLSRGLGILTSPSDPKTFTTKDTKYHEGCTSSHCGLNPAANAPLHHPLMRRLNCISRERMLPSD